MEPSSDCWSDSLQLWDGPQERADTLPDFTKESKSLGRFCGNKTPGVIVTTTNVLRLVFSADSSVGGRGFKAVYDFLEMWW